MSLQLKHLLQVLPLVASLAVPLMGYIASSSFSGPLHFTQDAALTEVNFPTSTQLMHHLRYVACYFLGMVPHIACPHQ